MPRMSVGSQRAKRISITLLFNSSPIDWTISDLPIPGGPQIIIGRRISKLVKIAFRKSDGLRVIDMDGNSFCSFFVVLIKLIRESFLVRLVLEEMFSKIFYSSANTKSNIVFGCLHFLCDLRVC